MISSILEFNSYLDYLKAWLSSRPRKGFGELKRLADELHVSSTMMSQIFKGEKIISLELAVNLAEQLSMDEAEIDFFLLLVQLERAGSLKLKKKIQNQITKIQAEHSQVSKRIVTKVELSQEVLMEFYSHWSYSAIWNLCALGKFNSVQSIAQRLLLSDLHAKKVVDFLLREKMIGYDSGILKPLTASMHVGADSPFIMRHHTNWRMRALDQLARETKAGDLFFSGPINLSQELADQIRAELPSFIEKIIKRVIPSPSEVVRCLTIDYFEI